MISKNDCLHLPPMTPMNILVKRISYLFSLIPLWIIFAVKYGFSSKILNITYLVLIILYTILYIAFSICVRVKRRSTKIPLKITNIKSNNTEQLVYFMTYIIPFIFVDISSPTGDISIRTALTLLVILLMIGLIYCKTNLFSANPMLSVAGWSAYRAEITTTSWVIGCVILSKTPLPRQLPIDVRGIYLVDDEVILILDQ